MFAVIKATLLSCFIVFPAFAGYLERTFSHDQLSYENWTERRDHAQYTRKIAAFCHDEEIRVHDARDDTSGYLGRLGVNRGGYIPYFVVMREQRRMMELAYIAYGRIKLIRYSIREWKDPAKKCRTAADIAIQRINGIRDKFPPMN